MQEIQNLLQQIKNLQKQDILAMDMLEDIKSYIHKIII